MRLHMMASKNKATSATQATATALLPDQRSSKKTSNMIVQSADKAAQAELAPSPSATATGPPAPGDKFQ
jgi:hypothetical protein